MDPLFKYVSKAHVNVYLTIMQVVISGLSFFLLYRYLYETLGSEKIGLWSLVIAFASSARLAELGLAGGVVKFVAEARGRNDDLRAAQIIQTVLITLTVVVALLVFPAFELFAFGLSFLLDEPYLHLGVQVLPYTLLAVSMMVGVSVLSGGMDGYMLMGLRNLVLSFSHILYLVLVYLLVPLYDILGVAIAQCMQYIFLIITLWVLIKIRLRELPLLPYTWDFELLKSMLRYGITFQATTIVNMFFEPLIKVSMTYWSGLATLGLYEMANKLALQVRSLVVESNRIILPILAAQRSSLNGSAGEHILVLRSFRIVLISSTYIFGLTFIASPIISFVWLGHGSFVFVALLGLVSCSWWFNSLTGPVYFANQASGDLNPNLVSHIITCAVGILLGNALGFLVPQWGVALAASIAIISGGVWLLRRYTLDGNSIAWKKFYIQAL